MPQTSGDSSSRPDPAPRPRRFGLKLIALLVACTLALALGEVSVRLLDLGPNPLAPLPVQSYQLSANETLSYEFRPSFRQQGKAFDPFHDGIETNSAGFRDVERSVTKAAGTFRIVVLGDSIAAGVGTRNPKKAFVHLLEQRLNETAKAGRRFEVLNMAVGGYHTMQQAETLRSKGVTYSPDLVLVAFCLNDFNIASDGGVRKKLEEANGPGIGASGSVGRWLLRSSRLAFFTYYQLGFGEDQHAAWYRENVLKGRSAVRAGFELLSKLHGEHGFPVCVAIVPAFKDPFTSYRYHKTHKRVLAAAEGLPGIQVVDLLEPIHDTRKLASELTFDGLHPNDAGHEVLAEVLAGVVMGLTK